MKALPMPNLSADRLSCALGLCLLLGLSPALGQRSRVSLNDGWTFQQVDSAQVSEDLKYEKLKPWILPNANEFLSQSTLVRPAQDAPWAAAQSELKTAAASSRQVNLPHDWGIEGPFNQDYPGETGKLPWWGVRWYLRKLDLSTQDQGKRIILEVDGAMSYASVWINGKLAGGWPYGYASWQLDLTSFVTFGGENEIAIRLDNPPDSSRWYPGGGLYRNVWLTKLETIHMTQWGVSVTTPAVSLQEATIDIKVGIKNEQAAEATVTVANEIYQLKADGRRGSRVATQSTSELEIATQGEGGVHAQILIKKPRLWSIASPERYLLVTTLRHQDRILDQMETPFGIREFKFTVNDGFHLNGARVPIQGVCNHHDLGALGAAFNVRAAERQLEILKEMGCNAIRTSHNPPAPELVELCDRMGFVMMVEAFDCWKGRKVKNDYHLLFPEWSEADLRAMVRHYRNHPSVVLWSTGNEMPDQRNAAGVELSKLLTAIVHDEDPTRPVIAGCNHDIAGFNGFQNTVDVFGYNYKPQLYEKFHATNPTIPLLGSETASTVSSRGEYFFPVSNDKSQGLADFQVSSYDLYAPRWAMPPEREWQAQDTNTFVAGEFVWTGFDYLGEPTPYNSDLSNLNNYSNPEDRARAEQELAEMGKIRTPSRSSYFGIIDLAGFKKDRFYLYQSRWRPELKMAHLLPHWTWPERVGEITPVHVYTSGDEAELFLNGKSLGRKKKGPLEYRLRWDDVTYAPGDLKVVAYRHGRKWATDSVRTAGPATKLVVTADRSSIAADGKDLAFLTVQVSDRKGNPVPRAEPQIQFSVDGPGEIIATDNGDPTSFEPFQSSYRKAFNGLALGILRAKPGESGKIVVTVWADELSPAKITLRARK